MADIFFTYAPADAARAKAIAEALKGFGLDIAWDRTLLPGERYDAVVTRRLAEAKAVVVLWSTASVASSLIMDEAAAARDQGKLLPVRIDGVDSPLGFRQLQTADLAGWPDAENSAHGIQSLAEALARSRDTVISPTPPPPDWTKTGGKTSSAKAQPAPRGKLLTSSFWGWSGALALFCGLLYFISPAGQQMMAADLAGRIGNLIGSILMPFLIFIWARVLTYFSRRFVGKPEGRYFTVEMVVLFVIAILLAAINTLSPQPDAPNGGGGLMGFTHQLNFAIIGVFMLAPPLIFLVRGALRLIRGAPNPS